MPSQSLLAGCQRNDPGAWKRLVGDYSHAVYRWALFFGIPPSGAEEVTQEVFITATKKISFCQSPEQLSAWLFQITRRHAANFRRTAWARHVLGMGHLEKSREENLTPDEKDYQLSVEMHQVLKKMPVKLIEVLIMHDMDGYSREEISEQLGIPAGTVASRLAKARKMFKEQWRSAK